MKTWKDAQHLVIGEIQIKMKHHYTPNRMAKIQNTWHHQMLPRMWHNRNSYSLLVGVQNGTVTWEDILEVSYKKILLPYDPAIAFLGIYPNELKT